MEGAPGDFTTYTGIKAKVDNGSIAARVLNTAGGMPPSYSSGIKLVTGTDKMKIQAWINQGCSK